MKITVVILVTILAGMFFGWLMWVISKQLRKLYSFWCIYAHVARSSKYDHISKLDLVIGFTKDLPKIFGSLNTVKVNSLQSMFKNTASLDQPLNDFNISNIKRLITDGSCYTILNPEHSDNVDDALDKAIAIPDGETNPVVSKMAGGKLPAKPYQPTSEEMNSAWVYASVHQRLIDFTLDIKSEYLCLNFHPIDTAEPIPEHPFIELYSRGMVSKDIKVGFVSGNNMLNILNAVVYDALVRMQNEGIMDSHLLQFIIDDEFVNGGWKQMIYQDPSLYSFHNPTIANTVSWLHGFKPEVVIHDGIVESSKLFEDKVLHYCKMNGLEADVDFQYAFASINSEMNKKVTRL